MPERARLRWNCRRGCKELDLILVAYLEGQYDFAPAQERKAFQSLLSLSDPELIGLLLGEGLSNDPDVTALIEKIRSNPTI